MIYNPDNLDSVESFWEGSRIEHRGKVIGMSHSIKELPISHVEKQQLDERYRDYQAGNVVLHDWQNVHKKLREKYQ